jgi:hypothetical protein
VITQVAEVGHMGIDLSHAMGAEASTFNAALVAVRASFISRPTWFRLVVVWRVLVLGFYQVWLGTLIPATVRPPMTGETEPRSLRR